MNKHAPGPWSLGEPEAVGNGLFVPVHAELHGELATVVWRMEDDHTDEIPSLGCEANAKLIAAAPELLESLTNLVGLARLGAARIDKYHAALANAEAIIAKATQ